MHHNSQRSFFAFGVSEARRGAYFLAKKSPNREGEQPDSQNDNYEDE